MPRLTPTPNAVTLGSVLGNRKLLPKIIPAPPAITIPRYFQGTVYVNGQGRNREKLFLIKKGLKSPQHYPVPEQHKTNPQRSQHARYKGHKRHPDIIGRDKEKHLKLAHGTINPHRVAFFNVIEGLIYVTVAHDQANKPVVVNG